MHQLMRVVEVVTNGLNRNQSTGAIFLDVKKLFAGCDTKAWCTSYTRSLGRFGTAHSMHRKIGSLLSPLLYYVFTNGIPKTPGTILCQYVADTRVRPRVVAKLQDTTDALEDQVEDRSGRIKEHSTVHDTRRPVQHGDTTKYRRAR